MVPFGERHLVQVGEIWLESETRCRPVRRAIDGDPDDRNRRWVIQPEDVIGRLRDLSYPGHAGPVVLKCRDHRQSSKPFSAAQFY